MNNRNFPTLVNVIVLAYSAIALAAIPAHAELLIGISFPSQGGGDNDTVEIDESLLTLPKLQLQDASWLGPENRNWLFDVTTEFSTTYTEFHEYQPDLGNVFTKPVSISYTYSLGPAKFNLDGSFSTGITIREQPLAPGSQRVREKGMLDISATFDSPISTSVVAVAPGPATGILSASLNQGALKLDWPADYTGWILQSQTNTINSQWFPVLGSSATNRLDLTLDRAAGSVFFRLVPAQTQ